MLLGATGLGAVAGAELDEEKLRGATLGAFMGLGAYTGLASKTGQNMLRRGVEGYLDATGQRLSAVKGPGGMWHPEAVERLSAPLRRELARLYPDRGAGRDPNRYLALLEQGATPEEAAKQLSAGTTITVHGKSYNTNTCLVTVLSEEPALPLRNPPVRFRKNIPTSWISIVLTEGKNRQVRKMTAAVGFPTLRLVRCRIGNITLGQLQPGDMIEMPRKMVYKKLFNE